MTNRIIFYKLTNPETISTAKETLRYAQGRKTPDTAMAIETFRPKLPGIRKQKWLN